MFASAVCIAWDRRSSFRRLPLLLEHTFVEYLLEVPVLQHVVDLPHMFCFFRCTVIPEIIISIVCRVVDR